MTNLIMFSMMLSRYHAFELQLSLFSRPWTYFFTFSGGWSRRMDHAGPGLTLQVLGLYFNVMIYDTRHWSDETGYFTPGFDPEHPYDNKGDNP